MLRDFKCLKVQLVEFHINSSALPRTLIIQSPPSYTISYVNNIVYELFPRHDITSSIIYV